MSTSSRNLVENFIVIFWNLNNSKHDQNSQKLIDLVQPLVNRIVFVSNYTEYVRIVECIRHERLFIIMSGYTGIDELLMTATIDRIDSIYIYANHKSTQLPVSTKLQGVFLSIHSIRDALRRDLRRASADLITMNILSSVDSLFSFVCSYVTRESLLNLAVRSTAKHDLVAYSRLHYNNNVYQSKIIDEYDRQAYQELSPIQWYTRDCFLSSMLNRALRLNESELIILMSSYIKDLHEQIKYVHQQQQQQSRQLTVYYQRRVTNNELNILQNHVESLISFDTFLFTDINEQLISAYAQQSYRQTNLIDTIFRIQINPSAMSYPYLVVNELDYYQDSDSHVLFSIDAVFRLVNIEQQTAHFWLIDLILIEQNDSRMSQLAKSVAISSFPFDDILYLGQVMFNLFNIDRAEQWFNAAYKSTNKNEVEKLAYIHLMLGNIHAENNRWDDALDHFLARLTIQKTYLASNDPSICSIYARIGWIQRQRGEFNQALNYFQYAKHFISLDKQASPFTIAAYHNQIQQIRNKVDATR
jgi:hypothetical protein